MPTDEPISLDEFERRQAAALDDAIAHPEKYERLGEKLEGNPIALGPRVLPPDEWASKQLARAAVAGEDWLKRSLSPRKVPSQAALAKNDLRIAHLQDSIAKKTWEGAMNAVDEDERLRTIQAVGSSGYARGVQAREGKIRAKVARLQPLVAAHVQAIDGLPAKSDSDMETRVIANLRGMKAIGARLKGGR